MKKNRLMRIAALLLVLTLATSCFVGGTFAKYTSEFTAEDSARVAEWAFSVGPDASSTVSVDLAVDKTFTFELFDSIVDTVDGNDDADVDDSAKIIAPGTKGSITVVLKNDSEVNATYAVDYTETNEAGVPLKWSLNGTDWEDAITTFNKAATAIAMDATAEITLHWMWAFDGDDGVDTDLGIDGSAEPTVKVKITVEQVD